MIRQLTSEWRTLGVRPPLIDWRKQPRFGSRLSSSPPPANRRLSLKASVVPSGVTVDDRRSPPARSAVFDSGPCRQWHGADQAVSVPGSRPVAGPRRPAAAGRSRPSRQPGRSVESIRGRNDASKRLGGDRRAARTDERGQAEVRSAGYTEPRTVCLFMPASRDPLLRSSMPTALEPHPTPSSAPEVPRAELVSVADCGALRLRRLRPGSRRSPAATPAPARRSTTSCSSTASTAACARPPARPTSKRATRTTARAAASI